MKAQRSGWTRREEAKRRMRSQAVGTPCPDCGETMTGESVSIDHIIPRSSDFPGKHGLFNVRIVCLPCNRAKGCAVRPELITPQLRRALEQRCWDYA